MKLAEALLLRSDQEKKLASLSERVQKYALVQQGEKPHEDPAKLIKEYAAILGEWQSLVLAVNRANLDATLSNGQTLTEALAQRDALIKHRALIVAAVAGSSKEPERYGLSEIKWLATMNVSDLQRQADDLSGELRKLNVLIQEANWSTELTEHPKQAPLARAKAPRSRKR